MLRRAGTASIVNLISFQRRLEARITAVVVVAHAARLQAVVRNAWLNLLVMAESSAQDKSGGSKFRERKRLDSVGDGRVDYCWF
jgi:hypothetical protein